jgi:hypothetical protein
MKRFFSNPRVALVAGAILRLIFVFEFPTVSGDSRLYEQLAANWLKLGKFALDVGGQMTPVDVRMPGYPAFLAIVYAMTRRTGESARIPVMLVQVLLDLVGCVVIAALAAVLAKLSRRDDQAKKIFVAALWLAALCPFTANYVAVVLTEVWAVLLTAIALVLLALVATQASGAPLPMLAGKEFARKDFWRLAAIGGFVVGMGALFRPETPLLLMTTFAVLGYWMLRRGDGKRWVLVCTLMGIACVEALVPWMIRNAVSLHEFQPLAPKDATLPSELVPTGFMAWERTWTYRMREAYTVTWKLNDEEISMEDIPAWAFDTPDERERVAMVLQRYNDEVTWTAEEDAVFAQLARERTARHPLRTYVTIPLRRAVRIWFTPRIELLPVSGHVFPLAYQWEEDPEDQRVTILMFFLNLGYVGLGLWGAWKLWNRPGARSAMTMLLAYLVVRTAFLTAVEAPEPRYVLECFPAVIALGSQAMLKKEAEIPGGGGD